MDNRPLNSLTEEHELEQQSAPLLSAGVQETDNLVVRRLRGTLPELQTMATAVNEEQAERRLAVQEAVLRRRRIAKTGTEAINGEDNPSQQLADILETFAVCLGHGMTESEAWERATKESSGLWVSMTSDVAGRLASGISLPGALEAHQQELPAIVVPILLNSTQYGTLERAVRQVVKGLKELAKADEKNQYSTFNPALFLPLLIMLTTPIFALLILSLPYYSIIFTTYLIGCIGLSTWVWTKRYARKDRKPRIAGKAYPQLTAPFGGIHKREMSSANWSRTLSILVDSGVPISYALESAAHSAGNPHYVKALTDTAARTRAGHTLSDSLVGAKLLPDHLLNVVQTGELGGRLDVDLVQMAGTMEDDARKHAAQRIARIVLFLYWLFGFAATVVVFIWFGYLYVKRGEAPWAIAVAMVVINVVFMYIAWSGTRPKE